MVDADGEDVELYERVFIERDRRGRPVALRGVITEVSDLHERLAETRHNELHDPLTGLPNRRALRDELDGAVDHGRFALVLLDLDRFHEVNQVLGHDIGDRVLVQVAERFAGAIGALDTIAHLGGDTFAILAPGRRRPGRGRRPRHPPAPGAARGADAGRRRARLRRGDRRHLLCPADGRDAGNAPAPRRRRPAPGQGPGPPARLRPHPGRRREPPAPAPARRAAPRPGRRRDRRPLPAAAGPPARRRRRRRGARALGAPARGAAAPRGLHPDGRAHAPHHPRDRHGARTGDRAVGALARGGHRAGRHRERVGPRPARPGVPGPRRRAARRVRRARPARCSST